MFWVVLSSEQPGCKRLVVHALDCQIVPVLSPSLRRTIGDRSNSASFSVCCG
jgi:hypothetical protein